MRERTINMENQELTLALIEQNYSEALAKLNTMENKEEVKADFIKIFSQHVFKNVKDGLEHIESVKRAEKRMAELPALIEAKQKEIDELSFKENPEFHKKETREKVKVLTKELEGLENELKIFPDDIKHKLMQADLCFKNVTYNHEQIELTKKIA